MAWWIAPQRKPLSCVPPCSNTFVSRIVRVSWILMPGDFSFACRNRQRNALE
jgi:hypothetical protein